jgi:hypothetical protein
MGGECNMHETTEIHLKLRPETMRDKKKLDAELQIIFKKRFWDSTNVWSLCIPSFLTLGATAQGELWPPEQSASILLYSSSKG